MSAPLKAGGETGSSAILRLAPALLLALSAAQETQAPPSADPPAAAWDFGELASGRAYDTSITAQNLSCPGRQDFAVIVRGAPWLRLPRGGRIEGVRRGESGSAAAVVDLREVEPGELTGEIEIACPSCPPSCRQDVRRFTVRVLAQAAPPPQLVADERCALAVTKRQVYSRGQNNADQMKQQSAARRDGRLQYETARFRPTWTLASRCECRDVDGGEGCAGVVDVAFELAIGRLDATYREQLVGEKRRGRPPRGARAMVAVAAPPAGRRTRETDRSGEALAAAPRPVPRPHLEIHAPRRWTLPEWSESEGPHAFREEERPDPDVPLAAQGAEAPKRTFYVAGDRTTIPCSPGEHAARFVMVDFDDLQATERLARKRHDPLGGAPQIYADATIVLAEDACRLSVERFDAYLVEFRDEFPFPPVEVPGGPRGTMERDPADELPTVRFEVERRGRREPTLSLLKLVEEDGDPVDRPFPPKEKAVRGGEGR